MPNKKRTGAAQNARFSPEKHFPAHKLTKYEAISLANWLIRFTALDLSTFREKKWKKFRQEFTAFISQSIGLTDPKQFDFSQQKIQDRQEETKGYFDDLRDEYNKGFELKAEHHFIMKDGKL